MWFLLRLGLILGVLAGMVGVVLIAVGFWPLLAVIAVIVLVARRKQLAGGWAYGTSRLADLRDLMAAGLLSARSGIQIGRCGYVDPPKEKEALATLFSPSWSSKLAVQFFQSRNRRARRLCNKIIRSQKSIHTSVVAPTGGGKGIGIVIPNCRSMKGSLIVLDIGGDAWKHAARVRHQRFGQRIVNLGLYSSQAGDGFNVFDLIRPHRVIDDALMLANALIVPDPLDRDKHWVESARLILACIIAFVALHAPEADRHLLTVRQLLSNRKAFEGAMATMLQHASQNWRLAELAGSLSFYEGKELNSVMTTIHRSLSFMSSQEVVDMLTQTTFPTRELAQGKLSVFLTFPPEYVHSHAALGRLLITGLMMAIVQNGAQERHLTHVILDEVQQFGKMTILEEALTHYRKFGIRLMFLLQSAGQVPLIVEDPRTFWSNCTTQVFFGLSGGDMETAEMVSARIGDTTVQVYNHQENDGYSHSYNQGSTDNSGSHQYSRSSTLGTSEIGRRLVQSAEILRLPPNQVIAFVPGCRWPILAELAPFFETPEWTRNWLSGLGEIVSATFTTAITILLGFFVLACGVILVTHPNNSLRLGLPKQGEGTVLPVSPVSGFNGPLQGNGPGPYGEFTPASERRNAGTGPGPAAWPAGFRLR